MVLITCIVTVFEYWVKFGGVWRTTRWDKSLRNYLLPATHQFSPTTRYLKPSHATNYRQVTSFQQAAGLYNFNIYTHQGFFPTLTLVCCSGIVAVACNTIGTRKIIEVETVRVLGRWDAVGGVSVPYRGNSGAGLERSAGWPRVHLYGCSSQQIQCNSFHLDRQWFSTSNLSKPFGFVCECLVNQLQTSREHTPSDRCN